MGSRRQRGSLNQHETILEVNFIESQKEKED